MTSKNPYRKKNPWVKYKNILKFFPIYSIRHIEFYNNDLFRVQRPRELPKCIEHISQ